MLDLEYIETVLKAKEGFEFQRYSVKYLRNKHGYDFQAVDSKGRLGDRGKDGYIFKTKEYFAMSSQVKNLSDKIRRDFKNCMEKNLDVRIFTFVTNQKIGPKECDTRDALQSQHPETELRFLQHSDIAAELLQLSNREILIILGKSVPILTDNTIYFKENIEKQISFTLLESVKDSSPWYLATIIICVMAGVGLCYFSSDWARMLYFTGIVCLIYLAMLYVHHNRERIPRYKYALNIIYLLCGDHFRVGDEVILDSERHLTIKRNTDWNFTINQRSARCIKKGCTGKVYICRSESNRTIGRCEIDKINHVYNVDSNSYGEML